MVRFDWLFLSWVNCHSWLDWFDWSVAGFMLNVRLIWLIRGWFYVECEIDLINWWLVLCWMWDWFDWSVAGFMLNVRLIWLISGWFYVECEIDLIDQWLALCWMWDPSAWLTDGECCRVTVQSACPTNTSWRIPATLWPASPTLASPWAAWRRQSAWLSTTSCQPTSWMPISG